MRTTEEEVTKGGVCMVVRDRPQGWRLEATRFRGMNMGSCKVITDVKNTPIIGTYLSPSTWEYLPKLE